MVDTDKPYVRRTTNDRRQTTDNARDRRAKKDYLAIVSRLIFEFISAELHAAMSVITARTCRGTASKIMHLFVYGTLQKGQPNHPVMLECAASTGGMMVFLGRAKTVEKRPMVIAGRYNTVYILDCPGMGKVLSIK